MKILIVEDQDAIRRMIEALVSARGHTVMFATQGAKAIEVALASPPDMVLLDIHLPGFMDGFEVCKRLRKEPPTKQIPIVIISALDDPQAKQRAHEAGANAYFVKPFSPMALLKEIDVLKKS